MLGIVFSDSMIPSATTMRKEIIDIIRSFGYGTSNDKATMFSSHLSYTFLEWRYYHKEGRIDFHVYGRDYLFWAAEIATAIRDRLRLKPRLLLESENVIVKEESSDGGGRGWD